MKKRYMTLKAERKELQNAVTALLENAGPEGLTDTEKEQDDKNHARKLAIDGELERYDRARAIERDSPAADVNDFERIESMVDRRELDPMRGFRDIADFALSVRDATAPGRGHAVDERLLIGAAPTNSHSYAGDEGFMAPPALSTHVWNLVYSEESLLSQVDHEPTSQNSVFKDTDESTPWGSAGVQAHWGGEESQMSSSKLDTDFQTMRLHNLYAFVNAGEELLQDVPRLNARLSQKSGEAIDWKINEAFFDGNGAGKPLGWTQSDALVTVAKESAQTADTINAANVSKMYARMINPGQATWYMNQEAFSQLTAMTISNQPAWTIPGGLANAPGGTLLGRPIVFTEHAEALGDLNDIQFVNPKGYYAISRTGGPEYAESMHLYFDYNKKAFRWTFRLNGQPHLSAAISPNKGSLTRSHFITLAARA